MIKATRSTLRLDTLRHVSEKKRRKAQRPTNAKSHRRTLSLVKHEQAQCHTRTEAQL